MASLRERQRERRRQNILDAAWQLIGEKGLDNTSIEEVAARAEVGPATVYNYFGSKNDLLQALLVLYIEQKRRPASRCAESSEEACDGMAALFERLIEGMASRCTRYYPRILRAGHEPRCLIRSQTYAMKKVFLENVQDGNLLQGDVDNLGTT